MMGSCKNCKHREVIMDTDGNILHIVCNADSDKGIPPYSLALSENDDEMDCFVERRKR